MFSENLQKIRKQKRITQIELARISNVSQATISAIERGIKSPSVSTVNMIAKALNVNPAMLVDDSQSAGDEAADMKKEILYLYDALTVEQKKDVLEFVQFISHKNTTGKA